MVVRAERGGAFNQVVHLSSELVALGHDVTIAGPHEGDGLDLRIAEVPIARPISPVKDLVAAVRLGRLIRSFGPNLIHAHGAKGGALARIARVARPGVPVVFTPNQYSFANYFPGRSQRVYRIVERVLAPQTTIVLCVCENEREQASQIGPRERTRVVYNGIEPISLPAPVPSLEQVRQQGPVIGVVAELHPRKGLVTLIDALPAILERYPSATVAIAGSGDEADALAAYAGATGVSESIVWLGQVDDVPAVLAAFDVFVNPAYGEGFPYAVVEAMAAERAIVATDVGGTREAIEDGVTGRLIAPERADQLSEAVLSLLDDPSSAAAMAKAALERMLERFTYDSMIEGTLTVYRELGVE